MKNVFKIALLNILFFGFLHAPTALALEQSFYLETAEGQREIQFASDTDSVTLGLYYQPS